MRVVEYYCDGCGCYLESKSLENGRTDIPKCHASHETKEWDTKETFEHLCMTCAQSFDKVLSKYKKDITTLSERKAINELRREQSLAK